MTEKIILDLTSTPFEKGLDRAQRKFKAFRRRVSRGFGFGAGGAKSFGEKVGKMGAAGGTLGAVAGGFGAVAVVSQITGAIQKAFDGVAQRQRNVAMRAAGPAGSQQNALAQMQAAAVQTRKVIFGFGDAMEGITLASLGTKDAFNDWKESLMSAVNATDDYAKGLERLKFQEMRQGTINRQRAIALVHQGEDRGLIEESYEGSGAMIRRIQKMNAGEAGRLVRLLQDNIAQNQPLGTRNSAGANSAALSNWQGLNG